MSINSVNSGSLVAGAGAQHAKQAISSFRTSGVDFGSVLQQKVDKGLKFSAHAESRMLSRGINLDNQALTKLSDAVDGVEKKGAKDTLILLSNQAFIVNVPNRTVVTAMEGNSIRDNVFTNIDSTVIAG